MPAPLVALGVAGGLAWAKGKYDSSKATPTAMNHDFSFDLQKSQYNANPNMLASINNLNNSGNTLNAQGQTFMNQYSNMIDPNSAYNQNQIAQAGTQVADAQMQRQNAQQQAIASTGGPKNLSGLLGVVGRNQGAESLLNATRQIQQQSVNQAGQFGQMGTQATAQGVNAFAQAGGLAGQIDQNTLQNAQFNAQNQNQYNQYLSTSQYNQDSANAQNQYAHQQAQANQYLSMGSSLMGLASGLNYG